MNRMHLFRIALCFLLLEGVMGVGLSKAEPDGPLRPESQLEDGAQQERRGPQVKAVVIQGPSQKMVIRPTLSEEEREKREKAFEAYLRTQGVSEEEIKARKDYTSGKITPEEYINTLKRQKPVETIPVDEERIRQSLRMKGKSEGEIDYFIKTFVRGEIDPEEGKVLTEAEQAETDQYLHAIWERMRTALADNNIETAASCIAEKKRTNYRRIFKSLSDEDRLDLVARLEDLRLIKFHSARYAEYDVQEIRDGQSISWMVIFIKTPWENEWKINGF
ncbi:MAG: hypothetical protein QNJ04_06085 [Desulfobacterales bacterium]|nr:hypothetical protein [Desulfobacterales bacterium]